MTLALVIELLVRAWPLAAFAVVQLALHDREHMRQIEARRWLEWSAGARALPEDLRERMRRRLDGDDESPATRQTRALVEQVRSAEKRIAQARGGWYSADRAVDPHAS